MLGLAIFVLAFTAQNAEICAASTSRSARQHARADLKSKHVNPPDDR